MRRRKRGREVAVEIQGKRNGVLSKVSSERKDLSLNTKRLQALEQKVERGHKPAVTVICGSIFASDNTANSTTAIDHRRARVPMRRERA